MSSESFTHGLFQCKFRVQNGVATRLVLEPTVVWNSAGEELDTYRRVWDKSEVVAGFDTPTKEEIERAKRQLLADFCNHKGTFGE